MQKNNIQIKLGQQLLITIKRLGINGEGIGYYKRKIVFVPRALPTEIVIVEVSNVHPKYIEATLIRIKKSSSSRVEPRDKYTVGGIELEHLAYSKQLEFKRDVIAQSLEKFKPLGYDKYELRPTLGMKVPYNYRNKAQFQVQKNKAGKIIAGLYRENSHYLVDLPTFSTQTALTMKIIREVCLLLQKWNIPIYDEKRNTGIVRTIVVRESFAYQNAQLVFVTHTEKFPQLNNLIADIKTKLPEVVSIMQNINKSKTSLVWGERTQLIYGKEYLMEKLGELQFKLSARAFFQLNPKQTLVLYDQVKEALKLQATETLIDAYCGVGTIGLYVSDQAKEIRGMDVIPESIRDAKENARLGNRKNTKYFVGHAEKLIPQWVKDGFVADALVVDPPRTGLDKELITAILKFKPRKFVYVSCNPSTMARDLVLLAQIYNVNYVQSIDMFPQTARVEAVVSLTLK
ncbi:23S rRNA (uracil(1939)-C(5))-methyltransferase RlmD [Ligilactobacillus sp. WILCCON 0076]|uniref:23S rRNA (Uracil(1939)-C(5))-methyltransferase RlmD n=1 Tax=Ligilactobacillus ubinensis TaxID=2876789 RepID=A0A9X2JMD8_9LACO|nr:23S rRNA (uracil(1939)-C(5))-methyltransferase RlmD [Ligilactobacillus ubinensis]MCP0887938.1 23S rRNA (uracil(1939)-C(5))-methyltransferase RlmD [Ligilactobacillus ubinensis]